LSAVAGPIPGTNCNSSEFAVLMFASCAGGFFFPAIATDENSSPMRSIGRKTGRKGGVASLPKYITPGSYINQ